jgi:hypothetical protein
MQLKKLSGLLLPLSVLVMFGCGGGGGGAAGTTAVVKVATFGNLSSGSAIGGIYANVLVNPSTGISISAGDVAATGAGAGSTLIPNVNDASDVPLALINVAGIQTGEFATLIFNGAAGASLGSGNFTIAGGANVVDLNGTEIPGITVVIQSVTVQ